MSEFIVSDSDDDIIDGGEDGESDEVDELFDYACAICDNGGQLLWYLLVFLSNSCTYLLMLFHDI